MVVPISPAPNPVGRGVMETPTGSDDVAAGLIRRFDTLHGRRFLWEKEWIDIADYILPRKVMALRGLTAGSVTTQKLYSSAPIKANADLASAMQGSLTNAAIRWFKLRFAFEELNEEPEASEWLETVADRMFLAMQQSNFAGEINEAYLDLGSFGTSATFLDFDTEEGKLRYKTQTIGEYVIAEGSNGKVDTVGRLFEMTARSMRQKFGIEKLHESVTKKLDEGKLDERFMVLHMVGPRPIEKQDPERAELEPRARPWGDFYVDHKNKVMIDEGGFFEFPWLVARWSKNANEEWGRGPGHFALPDVRTLNRARQLKFRQWAKTIDPPMQALEEGVIGQIRLTPSSLNFVRELNALQPIATGGNFEVAAFNENELIQSIKEVFFSDLVSLPPVQGTPMSATEAAQRFELMERKLGPTIGRLKNELLQPNIDRVFGLLNRAGFFPPVPDIVIQFFADRGVAEVGVEFEGPLERAQRQSDVVAIERTYNILGGIAQAVPTVLDVLDHDEIGKFTARRNGLPENFILTDKVIEENRAARAQAEAQAVQVEQGERQARAAKSAAGAAKDLKEAGIPIPTGEEA